MLYPFLRDGCASLVYVNKEDFGHLKLLVIGNARAGKDTVAEMMKSIFGLQFKSSSEACLEIFIYDALKERHGYLTMEQAFNDRVNHRALWHDMIVNFNTPDKSRLAREIMVDNQIYVGMRDYEEIRACKDAGIFNAVIWIDNDRVPLEPSSSFNIDRDIADYFIDNNGTKDELLCNVIDLMILIGKNGR